MSTETTVKHRGKKNPEDLNQKQVKKAAEGLRERLQKSGAVTHNLSELKYPVKLQLKILMMLK